MSPGVGGRVVVLALLAGTLLTGCGDGGDGGEEVDTGSGLPWPASQDVLDHRGLTWALDGVVHLDDGTEVDTGRDTTTFVVAGDGVLTADDGLRYVDTVGTEVDLGIEVGALAASPDGRLVAVIDLTSGAPDDYGTPRAEVAVADLTTGAEVLRTDRGMGGDEDDLAALYPEVDLGLRFTDESTLVVSGATEDYVVDVRTGGTAPVEPDPADDPTRSPDGAWRIESPGGLRDVLSGPDGVEVTPQTGSSRWNLEWWADASTVVGYAVDGGGEGAQVGDDATVVLVSCLVPAGTCERHEQTAGATGVSFPAGSRSVAAYSLTPRYVED